jgi:hypothetical protein
MAPPISRDYLVLFAVGCLVLLGPARILGGTFGDLALGRISLVHFLERYVLDLFLFVVLAYGVYRLTLWLVRHRVPGALTVLEIDDVGDGSSGDS